MKSNSKRQFSVLTPYLDPKSFFLALKEKIRKMFCPTISDCLEEYTLSEFEKRAICFHQKYHKLLDRKLIDSKCFYRLMTLYGLNIFSDVGK